LGEHEKDVIGCTKYKSTFHRYSISAFLCEYQCPKEAEED